MILRLTSLQGVVPLWQQVAAPVWLAGLGAGDDVGRGPRVPRRSAHVRQAAGPARTGEVGAVLTKRSWGRHCSAT